MLLVVGSISDNTFALIRFDLRSEICLYLYGERLVPEIFHDFVALTLICSDFLYYSPLFVFSLFFAIFS